MFMLSLPFLSLSWPHDASFQFNNTRVGEVVMGTTANARAGFMRNSTRVLLMFIARGAKEFQVVLCSVSRMADFNGVQTMALCHRFTTPRWHVQRPSTASSFHSASPSCALLIRSWSEGPPRGPLPPRLCEKKEAGCVLRPLLQWHTGSLVKPPSPGPSRRLP